MTNKFSHIKSNKLTSQSVLNQRVSHVKPEPLGRPQVKRVGRDVYDTLMGLLQEERETPQTDLGTFVANSTKRELRMRFEELFQP